MAQKLPEFWNAELAKLTWSGWLMNAVALSTVFAVAVPVVGLFRVAVGGEAVPQWLGAFAAAVGVVVATGVFEAGRHIFLWAGHPILRSDKR